MLASASPRRREILASLRIPFDVVIPDVEELTDGVPEEVVVENARRKAAAGLRRRGRGRSTLGVDTEVVLGGRLLGKAADRAEARAAPRGAVGPDAHRAERRRPATAPRASGGEPVERSGVARSEVTFRELDEATLETYLASGEWRDRAGAYAIQGLGSILIERVEGDFSNVVGLPVTLLLSLAPELLDPAGGSARNRSKL